MARGVAAAASGAKKANRDAPCVLDSTQTCRLPDAETGRRGEINPSAGDLTDASGRGSGTTQEVPVPIPQAVTRRRAPSIRSRRLPWADLLKRVFGVEALRCECGHSMRVIAAITEPTIASRILKCMGLPPRAPPLELAHTSGFAADPWLEEPADYDQSAPDNWEPGG